MTDKRNMRRAKTTAGQRCAGSHGEVKVGSAASPAPLRRHVAVSTPRDAMNALARGPAIGSAPLSCASVGVATKRASKEPDVTGAGTSVCASRVSRHVLSAQSAHTHTHTLKKLSAHTHTHKQSSTLAGHRLRAKVDGDGSQLAPTQGGTADAGSLRGHRLDASDGRCKRPTHPIWATHDVHLAALGYPCCPRRCSNSPANNDNSGKLCASPMEYDVSMPWLALRALCRQAASCRKW